MAEMLRQLEKTPSLTTIFPYIIAFLNKENVRFYSNFFRTLL